MDRSKAEPEKIPGPCRGDLCVIQSQRTHDYRRNALRVRSKQENRSPDRYDSTGDRVELCLKQTKINKECCETPVTSSKSVKSVESAVPISESGLKRSIPMRFEHCQSGSDRLENQPTDRPRYAS